MLGLWLGRVSPRAAPLSGRFNGGFMVSVGYHSSEGAAFDFNAYKRQCSAIAKAYGAWSIGDMSDLEYEVRNE